MGNGESGKQMSCGVLSSPRLSVQRLFVPSVPPPTPPPVSSESSRSRDRSQRCIGRRSEGTYCSSRRRSRSQGGGVDEPGSPRCSCRCCRQRCRQSPSLARLNVMSIDPDGGTPVGRTATNDTLGVDANAKEHAVDLVLGNAGARRCAVGDDAATERQSAPKEQRVVQRREDAVVVYVCLGSEHTDANRVLERSVERRLVKETGLLARKRKRRVGAVIVLIGTQVNGSSWWT